MEPFYHPFQSWDIALILMEINAKEVSISRNENILSKKIP